MCTPGEIEIETSLAADAHLKEAAHQPSWQKLTAVSQQCSVKGQHGLPNFVGNRALFILRAVLEVHQHVDLHRCTVCDFIRSCYNA